MRKLSPLPQGRELKYLFVFVKGIFLESPLPQGRELK